MNLGETSEMLEEEKFIQTAVVSEQMHVHAKMSVMKQIEKFL
jgi:hypothetical protein